MAVVQVITALSSRDPTIMHLLRCMHYFLALSNIHIWAVHIPKVNNAVADSTSCHHMQVFQQLAPLADPIPTPVPEALKTFLSLDCQAWLSPA